MRWQGYVGVAERLPGSARGAREHRGAGDTDWLELDDGGHQGARTGRVRRILDASRAWPLRVKHTNGQFLRGQTCQAWSPSTGDHGAIVGRAK